MPGCSVPGVRCARTCPQQPLPCRCALRGPLASHLPAHPPHLFCPLPDPTDPHSRSPPSFLTPHPSPPSFLLSAHAIGTPPTTTATSLLHPCLPQVLGMILRTGEVNLESMALLDGGHVAKFGHPEPSPVRLSPRKGKGILVSGHDMEVGRGAGLCMWRGRWAGGEGCGCGGGGGP